MSSTKFQQKSTVTIFHLFLLVSMSTAKGAQES